MVMDKKDKLLSLVAELSNRLDMEPDAQDVWELVEYMNCDGRLRFYNGDIAIDIDFVDGDIRHSSKGITLSKNFKIQMVHPTYLIGIEDDVKEFSIRHQIPHIFINMDDFVNRLAQAINVMEKCNVVSEPY